MSKDTYLSSRLKELGITPKINSIKITHPESPGSQNIEIFTSDKKDNIDITYIALDGMVETYLSGKKEKDFIVKRLKDPIGDKKYDVPRGSGLKTFKTPGILQKFKSKKKIKTLIITEGEFKAFKGFMHGLDILGIGGIHNFSKQGTLHPDFEQIIKTCKVDRVIFLTDSDCFDISADNSRDLSRRPNMFYTAVSKFRKLFIKFEVDISFSYIKPGEKKQGLDDLLVDNKGKESNIIKDFYDSFEQGKGKYFVTHDITFAKEYTIKQIFLLTDVHEFFKLHKNKLYKKVNSFVFQGRNYEIAEDGSLYGGDRNSTIHKVEKYLNAKYDFRFNTIKGRPEWSYIGRNSFEPLKDRTLASIRREMNLIGIKFSKGDLADLLISNFSQNQNPINEYFKNLPVWDGKDYILELAETMPVKNVTQSVFADYLKKWMIACVANALTYNMKCQNHLCLVLCGEKGVGKTTWLNNICPPDLKDYHFMGKIDPKNKDALSYLAENFLINIDDQLRELNKRSEDDLKGLITQDFVKYRRPYGIFMEFYSRIANFMGSVNDNDYLTDFEVRRFLSFEVGNNIDYKKKVDINSVWGQAYSEFKSGVKYWFDSNEIDELYALNQAFQMQSIEYELLINYYEAPKNKDQATHCLSTGMILTNLTDLSGNNRLSLRKLGQALKKAGFIKWQKRTSDQDRQWVYNVIQKSGAEISGEIKADHYNINGKESEHKKTQEMFE